MLTRMSDSSKTPKTALGDDLRCKKCGDTHSWHEWAQKPYCSPWCASTTSTSPTKASLRANPERLLKEYGGKELLRTSEGRAVLSAARSKYKKELLQPSDPDFHKEYGKQIKQNEEAKRDLSATADRLWEGSGGRTKHFR